MPSMVRSALAALIVVVAGCSGFSKTPDVPPASLVMTGGKIVTVDRDFSIRTAIAIRGERIAAVGTDAEIRAHIGRDTKVIDLKGRTVIPGLIDSHLHN